MMRKFFYISVVMLMGIATFTSCDKEEDPLYNSDISLGYPWNQVDWDVRIIILDKDSNMIYNTEADVDVYNWNHNYFVYIGHDDRCLFETDLVGPAKDNYFTQRKFCPSDSMYEAVKSYPKMIFYNLRYYFLRPSSTNVGMDIQEFL